MRGRLPVDALLLAGYLLLCLLLGGASAAGIVVNGVLQIAGVALLAFYLLRPMRDLPLDTRRLGALLIALAAVPLLQLVILPPGIWTLLPGRGPIADGYVMLGRPLPWLPISLAPRRTTDALLALVPALTLAWGAARLDTKARTLVLSVAVMFTVPAVLLALTQIAGGGAAVYPYAITNFGAGVGFFANANHQATLLLIAMPGAAALAARWSQHEGDTKKRARASGSLGVRTLLTGALVFAALGVLITGSLAGFLLLLPCVLASMAIYGTGRSRRRLELAVTLVALLAAVGLVLLGPVSRTIFGAPVAGTVAGADRATFAKTVFAHLWSYMPFGSGLGSFPLLYPSFTDPARPTWEFINHAHDDWLELLLETGVFGVIVAVAAAWWVWRRFHATWPANESGTPLARAGAVGIGVVAVHSFADYPARTAAIAALVGLCAALLTPEPPGRRRDRADRARHAGV